MKSGVATGNEGKGHKASKKKHVMEDFISGGEKKDRD